MPKRTAVRLTKTLIEQTAQDITIWDADVPGFGLRVHSTSVKSFIFQYRARDGRQGKMVLGKHPAMTIDIARKTARELRVKVDQGGNPSAERREHRQAATLKDMAVYYWEVYGPGKPLTPSYLRDAQRLLERFALPRFGSRKIASLVQSDIRAMTADATKNASPHQANKLQAVLSRIFSLAIADGLRTDNPCRGLDKHPEEPRTTYMTEAQVRKFLAACDAYPDRNVADAIRLLLFTGARLQEVLRASWDQFDLEKAVWIKPSTHTKTKRMHRLELSEPVVAMLHRMKSEAVGCYLFPGRSPDKPRTTIRRPWKKIEAVAGIGHFYRHDLRRTMASFMLSSGSELATVGKALGHTQAQTTMRYAYLLDGAQRAAADRAVALMLE